MLLETVVGTLFVTGLLGFFGLSEVWRSDIAPDLRDSVSNAAFTVIDDAVTMCSSSRFRVPSHAAS